MKQKLLSLLVIALVLLAANTDAENASYCFEDIINFIKTELKNNSAPSIAVAVARDGKIIWEGAFGCSDLENKIAATVETSYQLASVSKPMTATATMVLVKKGILDLDGRVSDCIQPLQFKVYEGNASDVKIRHLLNHTSGLSTYFNLCYADEPRKMPSFEESFRKFGALVHPAGVICEYSNLGYGLVDYIISKTGQMDYRAFMETEVFHPLNMKNSFVDKPTQAVSSIAKKYDSNMSALPDIAIDTLGAGGIYSSVHDLILFGMFHLKNELENQAKIISNEMIDMMQNFREPDALFHYYNSAFYGLGWYGKPDGRGTKEIWHEGGMMGASSIIKLIPGENVAIAVMTNTSNNVICREITNKICSILIPAYKPDSFHEVADYKPFKADPDFLGTWRGTLYADDVEIPVSVHFQEDGDIIYEYLDNRFKSYFTNNNPIPHKTLLLSALRHTNHFIGMVPGNIPAKDIRSEFSHFLSLKLLQRKNILTGVVTALPAADREYYAYSYYIKLKKADG